MGSLPYVPHPRDDTKGDACPPLDTPAEMKSFLILFETAFLDIHR